MIRSSAGTGALPRWPADAVLALATAGCVAYVTSPLACLPKHFFLTYLALLPVIFAKDKARTLLLLFVFLQSVGPLGVEKHFLSDPRLDLYVVFGLPDLIILCLLAHWAVLRPGEGVSLSADLALPLFGLFSAALFSLAAADNLSYSGWQVFRLFRGILVFYYVAHRIRDEDELMSVIHVLLSALLLESVIALLQKGGAPLSFLDGALRVRGFTPTLSLDGNEVVNRVSGSFDSPTHFSFLFLDYLIPLLVSLFFLRASRRKRPALTALLCVSVPSLIYTFSRGAWIGVALAVTFFFIARAVRREKPADRTVGALPMAALAALLALNAHALSARVLSSDGGSSDVRVGLMRIAGEMIRSHPLLGIGLGNFQYVMHLYDRTAGRVSSYFPYPVHNIYLLIASETGIPALLCFMAFIFSLTRRAFSVFESADPSLRTVSLGLWCGLAAALVHGLFEFSLPGELPLFWIFAGLLAAQHRMAAGAA